MHRNPLPVGYRSDGVARIPSLENLAGSGVQPVKISAQVSVNERVKALESRWPSQRHSDCTARSQQRHHFTPPGGESYAQEFAHCRFNHLALIESRLACPCVRAADANELEHD